MIRSALDQPAAGIGNDQLHSFEAAIDQVPQKASQTCPPRPSQMLEFDQKIF
jgi:hypothetical protein